MAKVAKQWLVWNSEPRLDTSGNPFKDEFGNLISERIEVAMDSVVPDTVPIEVQQDWENHDLVFEDPTKENVAKSEGPPRMTLPPMLAQKMDQNLKKMNVGHRGIPPRPQQKI